MSLRYAVVRKEGDKQNVEKVRVTRHFRGKDNFAREDSSDDELFKDSKSREKSVKIEVKQSNIDDRDGGDDDSGDERREMLRKRLAARLEEEEEDSDVKSEENSDQEIAEEMETPLEEDLNDHVEVEILKPLFIPKTHRSTIFEMEKQKEDQERIRLEQEKKLSERQVETQAMIKAKRGKEVEEDDSNLPDDEDDEEDDAEYEFWKQRELLRVKRERHERYVKEKEKADIERRRNMSDLERRQEDEEIENSKAKEPKKHWNYLQKYYHQGAFYQDEKEKGSEFGQVLSRDYTTGATGDDVMNREVLPAVMQVKNWGKKGRTKHTHLTAEDTTFIGDKDTNPLLQDDIKRKLARDVVVQQQNALKKRKL